VQQGCLDIMLRFGIEFHDSAIIIAAAPIAPMKPDHET
jgi:hypothetical protein